MRLLKSLFVVTLLSLSAAPVYASSTTCLNKQKRLTYTLSTSDGGAARNPQEKLTLKSKVLIEREGFNSDLDVALARLTLIGEPIERFEELPVNNYKKVQFYQQALVTSSADRADILFDGIVACEQSVYVGPPRP